MPKRHEIICIICPLGCKVDVTMEDGLSVTHVEGAECKLGSKYARSEAVSPKRILTTTVKVESTLRAVIPVRTDRPIPKDGLTKCMKISSGIRVRPPIKIGDIIVENIAGTGVRLISTGELNE